MQRYFIHYKGETTHRSATREEALKSIRACYRNEDDVLDKSSYNQPVQTRCAYVWMENDDDVYQSNGRQDDAE